VRPPQPDTVSSETELVVDAAALSRRSKARPLFELRRAAEILLTLTVSDLRVRYGRGFLLPVRWLFDPFILVGVYLVLVSIVLNRPGNASGLSIACSVVPFQLVTAAVANAMITIAVRAPIITNMNFRRSLIPLSSVFTESASFLASFTVIATMMAIYRVAPTAALLWLTLLIPLTVLLAAAFAYPAAIFGVWFIELRSFGQSFVRILFFLGPGLVPLSQTGGRATHLLRLNPLTGLFEAYRDVFLYGRSPAAWELLIPFTFAVVVLSVIVPFYRREQRELAKLIG
jgi:lipopolysaccharide transport system permease protein